MDIFLNKIMSGTVYACFLECILYDKFILQICITLFSVQLQNWQLASVSYFCGLHQSGCKDPHLVTHQVVKYYNGCCLCPLKFCARVVTLAEVDAHSPSISLLVPYCLALHYVRYAKLYPLFITVCIEKSLLPSYLML
jgi:hypothetical protein